MVRPLTKPLFIYVCLPYSHIIYLLFQQIKDMYWILHCHYKYIFYIFFRASAESKIKMSNIMLVFCAFVLIHTGYNLLSTTVRFIKPNRNPVY